MMPFLVERFLGTNINLLTVHTGHFIPKFTLGQYEWDGARHQKDYLIEKDVPVEDIDWFATLISCLFFFRET